MRQHRLSQWAYSDMLEAYGFNVIGSGAFSRVHNGGRDKVIKVSRDTAWLAWISWAQQAPNRLLYAPKLYGVKWHKDRDGDSFFVALVERIHATAKVRKAGDLWDKNPHSSKGLQWFIGYCRAAGFHMNDLHHGNWGFRKDGSVVIIDPTTCGPDRLEARSTKLRLRSPASVA